MYILITIIIVFVLAVLLIPTSSTVSVSTIINKPSSQVFDYIKLIKNQEHYSVWVMQDPNLKLTYTGTDGTVGFRAAWDSKVAGVGAGSQTVTTVTDSRYDVDLHFDRPMKGDNKAAIWVESISDNQTRITTEFYSTCNRPANLISPIGNYIIRKSTKQNLANLKAILEK